MKGFSFRKNKVIGNTAVASLFKHFRQILDLNNQVLEMVADLERALGGEYIFDTAFLQSSVTGIIEKGRQVIYHLNSMTHDQYLTLYDQFTATSDHLTDILEGGAGPYGGLLVLPGEVLHRDLVHLAGAKGANLGETKNNLNLPTPPLFAISTTGYRSFMEENDLYSRIDEICTATNEPIEQASQIKELMDKACFPADVSAAIKENIKHLQKHMPAIKHYAVRSSAVGEDGERSFAGQFHSRLNVPASRIQSACKEVIQSRFSERLLRYIDRDATAEDTPMSVLVQPMIASRASGILYTRDPNNPSANVMIVSAIAGAGEAIVQGRASSDKFIISRKHPFSPLSSELKAHNSGAQPSHCYEESSFNPRLRQGSGVIGQEILQQLSEYGLLLEKRFEWPQDIEWCVDQDEQLWILQARPLALQIPASQYRPNYLSVSLQKMPVLLQGKGHVGQLGLATGPVVIVHEESETEHFPIGAIAVSHYASPRLAGIVERSAAIITDIGSPTGHLATIAREYRTPALFGAERATALLQAGQQITVDIEDRTIYAGHLDIPLDLPQGTVGIHTGNQEASILRRLLRLIAPLNLTNPASKEFTIKNCQTIHDFLRFCHEKAVTELIDFNSSGSVNVLPSAPVFKADIPLNIRLIDLGGGLTSSTGKHTSIDQIASLPLRSLLQGISNKALWDQTPAQFGARDFLTSLTKPLSMLTNPPSYSGQNIAIIAHNYCNLSLRLGYHFNIIDSYLSDDPDDNYIYFRFIGGFAERKKREQRAALIGQILTGLYFKIEQHGDLIQGKAKMLERDHLENILTHIGELVAFTRQLDVRMTDEETISQFYTDFFKRVRQSNPSKGH